MKLNSATIRNFKAIDATTLPLSEFNVIVGPNGSGKSSVLQALHWVIQSARNPSVDTNRKDIDGSTLSLQDATYMPSPDYKNSGNQGTYGNFRDARRLDLHLQGEETEQGQPPTPVSANLWLKAARNEGVSVHVPSNNALSARIRDREREFSAYIPGLAGIPLSEERHAQSIVLRQAAAGDANTVLRNILLLLRQREDNAASDGPHPFTELQSRLSQAIRPTELQVSFDDQSDYQINATFRTTGMAEYRALELAGIGFLQAIQIFAYIALYQPRLLLIDEPDSHLHPDAQERLVREIARAAHDHDCQVIMTTHSPNVIRALPDHANVIWMQNGQVAPDSDQARQRMGWGILDKSLVLLTEDSNTDMLRLLLSQWPVLARQIAIWPLHGCGNLPRGTVIDSLRQLLGDVPMLMHRDGDMMLPQEREYWRQKWGLESHQLWITEGADIEAYFTSAPYLAAVTGVDENRIQTDILDPILPEAPSKDFQKKREDARALYPQGAAIPATTEVFAELRAQGMGHIQAKSIKPLRHQVQKILKNGFERGVGKNIPNSLELANDLKLAIETALLLG